MESASTRSKGKGSHPGANPSSIAITTRNRPPRAPFSAYPKRLKLSDLSELSELSRLSRRSRELDEPSTVKLSGTGTAEAPFEIPESPTLLSTSGFQSRHATVGDALDPDAPRAEMQQLLRTNIAEKKKKEYPETTASPHELSSPPTPASTSTHREKLRQLPRSSEAPTPLTSSLAPPIPITRRIIPTKGVLLNSNTEDTYIYHHEIGAIISQDPVNEDDSGQEEIILLVEVGAGLVAKTNTANTIVICKTRIDVNRLGRSFDNDRWIALVHPKMGKVWLFRIPHVRLLVGGRRPVAKCGICEGVIPEGKVAHGCVYTRDAVGDGGDTEPLLSNAKKVRFALK
ncbi:hypothetical protein C7212DRAFT_276276 [Tuber magnatum]|uniref:Uncharacterized protein n=1 Tax=Tuber magnatum TaxID=42249 RepID=A0A317T0Y2_9PEZI|nr:hypothetical protein C7212DRAFT_276276 [Tuber magnatum]